MVRSLVAIDLCSETKGFRFVSGCYNQVHNILRLFDDLPNFLFTTSETMRDTYVLPHELPNDLRPRTLKN